jgi:beta-phosphoglucomutase family hydrolase
MPDTALGLPDAVTACLFDLDGVLTDTASVHRGAWKRMFDDYLRHRAAATGEDFRAFTETDYERFVDGRPRRDGTREFLRSRGIELPEGGSDDPPGAETVHGLSNEKNQLVLGLIDEQGVTVFDGSVAYVRRVRGAGLRTAVVSSSANTAQVLDVAGIADLFEARIDGVVAAERHLPGKPAPDTFLAGAAELGVPAGAAAVFEDALAGVEAGRSGGFGYVVGVDRTGQAEALLARGADVVVGDLAELLGTGGAAGATIAPPGPRGEVTSDGGPTP